MSTIFLSYRRDDTSGHAGRLYDRLAEKFGKQQLFRDVDQITYGEDFVEAIESAVGSCKILVAVMGPRWLDAIDKHGKRRLDNPYDFVRLEIESALNRNVPVLPVLVGGAGMPEPDDLPDSLSGLARRQALEISETRFDYDVGQLIEAVEPFAKLKEVLPQKTSFSPQASAPKSEAEKPEHQRRNTGLSKHLEGLALPASVQHRLATLTEELQLRFLDIYQKHKRSTGVAYLVLLLPLPILGLHNLYLHQVFRQLLYWGVCGALASLFVFASPGDRMLALGALIWPVVDLFLLPAMVKRRNEAIARQIVLDSD